jgi:rhodanese-related sulfurtransferase
MTSAIRQALIIVVISAVIGGFLNLIRADRIPWISTPASLMFVDPGNPTPPDSLKNMPVFRPRGILIDGLQEIMGREGVIIDSRLPEYYQEGHIVGAINIPFEEIDHYVTKFSEIPQDTMAVLYCDGVGCDLAYDLAIYMITVGYSNVYVYDGGWEEWSAAALPVVKGDTP